MRGDFHFHVTGGVEHQRHDDDFAAVARGAIQTLIEQHVGEFDETYFDVPAGLPRAPLRGKRFDFIIAVCVARTVPDQ